VTSVLDPCSIAPSNSFLDISPGLRPRERKTLLSSLGSLDGGGAEPARRRGKLEPTATVVHHGPRINQTLSASPHGDKM
jgi:hypothetical protein